VIVTARTRVFALLGDPVAHSVSPPMHNAAFAVLGLEAVYVALRVGASRLEPTMRALAEAGGGGNVTVPHKEAAARALDPPSPALNTFWGADGRLLGASTDAAGILAGLDRLEAPATTWLVVGTGGSSLAVLQAARERGARVAVRSRSAERAGAFRARMREAGVAEADPAGCEVVINATPLGLGAEDPLPLEPDQAAGARWGLDLVYAPGETRWVRELRRRGLQALDGREVLVGQGAAALTLWFPGVDPPREVMRAVVRMALG
jgi:shikimate dehydrogenase